MGSEKSSLYFSHTVAVAKYTPRFPVARGREADTQKTPHNCSVAHGREADTHKQDSAGVKKTAPGGVEKVKKAELCAGAGESKKWKGTVFFYKHGAARRRT